MDPRDRLALESNLVDLSRDLGVFPTIALLKQWDVFQDWQEEEIQAKNTMSEKRQHLVKLVKMRGPSAFGKFLYALHLTHQHHLVQLLDPDRLHPPCHQLCSSCVPALPSPGADEKEGWDGSMVLDMPETTAAYIQMATKIFRSGKTFENFTDPKGLCLIINIAKFTKRMFKETPKLRLGSDCDAQMLLSVFKALGYDTTEKKNLTAADMRGAIRELRAQLREKKDGLRRYDSVVVCVLSHGKQGKVYGTDGEKVGIPEFQQALDAKLLPEMADCPKLLFFQACRGNRYGEALTVTDGLASCFRRQRSAQEEDDEKALIKEELRKVPEASNFFFGFATAPGLVCFRNEKKGSWFIQCLCHAIAKNAQTLNIDQIFTEVRNSVANRYEKEVNMISGQIKNLKQSPWSESSLRKEFFFYPAIYGRPQ